MVNQAIKIKRNNRIMSSLYLSLSKPEQNYFRKIKSDLKKKNPLCTEDELILLCEYVRELPVYARA